MKGRPSTALLWSLFQTLLVAALVCVVPSATAKGGGAHSSYSTGTHGHSGHSTAPGVKRGSHGNIERSEFAKNAFKKSQALRR